MMKKYFFFLFLLFTTLLFSCSEHTGIVDGVSLKGQVVNIDTANIQRWPMWPISLFGDVLYASAKLDSKIGYTGGKLTKNEWQKAEPLLIIGHGHNEFGHAILSQGSDEALYVLNQPNSVTYLVSLTKIPHADSISAVKDETKWEKYDLGQLPSFWMESEEFVVMSDSTILVAGAPATDMSHVFSIINYKNQTVTPLDYWPFKSSDRDRIKGKFQLYTHHCGLLDNGKDKYLYWNGWGPHAFIFSIDGSHTNILSELRTYTFTKEVSTERVTCCADGHRIYLLYKDSNSKGEKLEKYKDQEIFGNTIDVYDWDGVKQQVIHLDHYGQSIKISKDSKTLYLLSGYSSDFDKPYIYSYDLSSLK